MSERLGNRKAGPEATWRDDLNDTVTLTFATGQNITDPAGNALVNVTPTSGTNDNFFVLDNTAPTVTITAASTSTGPFTATFTFDEAVTGFASRGHHGGQRRALEPAEPYQRQPDVYGD